jgi:superfamily I DNA/RNA helicase
LPNYLTKYNPVQLRWDRRVKHDPNYKVYNFGESKGLSFDRVVIYPTSKIEAWIKNNTNELADETRAKFYVAITRARKSVAIVVGDNIDKNNIGNECCFYSPTV